MICLKFRVKCLLLWAAAASAVVEENEVRTPTPLYDDPWTAGAVKKVRNGGVRAGVRGGGGRRGAGGGEDAAISYSGGNFAAGNAGVGDGFLGLY